MGFMITDHWIEVVDQVGRDVRGVADHKIDVSPPRLQRFPPTALVQMPLPLGSQSLKIGPG